MGAFNAQQPPNDPFERYDIVETSLHFNVKRLDLHIIADSDILSKSTPFLNVEADGCSPPLITFHHPSLSLSHSESHLRMISKTRESIDVVPLSFLCSRRLSDLRTLSLPLFQAIVWPKAVHCK